MTTPTGIRTGSVQVKFADGSEHTLPIHGITLVQVLYLADELGIKSLEELKSSEPTLAMIRFITHAAARALTFENTQDIWTLKRIEQSFADMQEIVKVFLACVNLSPFPKAPENTRPANRKATYQ